MVRFYQRLTLSASKFADCLSQPCKKDSMGRSWSVADMQEWVHGGLMVYRKRARKVPRVVVGLSQTCERVSMGCGWSVVGVRDSSHGV